MLLTPVELQQLTDGSREGLELRGGWRGVRATQRDPGSPGVLLTAYSLPRPVTHKLFEGSDPAPPNLPAWQRGRHRGLYSRTSAAKGTRNPSVTVKGVGGLITDSPSPGAGGGPLPVMLC